MPQTRSGTQASDGDKGLKENSVSTKPGGSKRKQPTKDKGGASNSETDAQDVSEVVTQDGSAQEPPAKAAKQETATRGELNQQKLEKLLQEHGSLPLSGFGLDKPGEPTAPTVLAHLLNAMLTSARISHALATKTVKCLIEANYHHIDTLIASSWEERTDVLTKGGYTRYREKTATGLGELADLVSSKYDGDLNKLRAAAVDDPHKVRELIKEVKGLGEVGVNVFNDTVQAVWPCMAPYVDPRSFGTAEELGVGKDVQALWQGVGKDPVQMARLCSALTTVRLERKEGDFKDDDGKSD
ncbi:MAG: hypothetical protein Q9162_007019 [Coniocarpon cinnabarinum]